MADGSRSSQAGQGASAHSAWVRWLLPSVADVIFIAFLGVLVATALSVRLLGDAGIGWHVRTGQQILATHSIPRVDSFSSTMSGKPWFAWEWMYDVAVGEVERKAGLNGVVLFTAVVIAAVFASLFRLLVAGGTHVLLAALLVLLAAAASMIHFLARPHVVSWLFTLLWFWILDSSERRCFDMSSGVVGRQIWLLPLLMLVWVNMHGGFVVAFVLLGIYGISALWRWHKGRGTVFQEFLQKLRARKRVEDLALVTALTALATLVNPYGWHLHAHIYRYLSNRFLMDHIDEFRSPNFHGIAERCFAGLILVALVVLARRGRGLRLSEGFVVLFCIYSGLYASRNIPVASILLVSVAGPLASEPLEKIGRRITGQREQMSARSSSLSKVRMLSPVFWERMPSLECSLRGHLWPIATLVAACGMAANGGRLGPLKVMDAYFDEHRFPIEAVDYLGKNGVPGPVLAPDSWGGYLIYRLYPRVQVVVDDRHDLYGELFLRSYLRMVRVEPGWDGFLREHPARCVLVPRASPLANILAETGTWKTIYADEVAIAYAEKRATIQ